jgi:ABC-type spermidine/putrescine transport system permease subunit I
MSLPLVLLAGGATLVPLAFLVRMSLNEPAAGRGFYQPGTWTTANLARVFDQGQLPILFNTLVFAIAVSSICLTVGYPIALWLRMLSKRHLVFAIGIVLFPKMAGTLAVVFGWQRLLPRGFVAATIVEVSLILPYVILMMWIPLRSIDRRLESASAGLGASHWQTFRRVTWPLSRPGVVLALQLSFAWGVGAFVGPLFLDGPEHMTLSVELHRQAFDYGRWPLAAADALALFALSLNATLGFRQRRLT